MWESLRGGARSTSQSQHQDGQPHGLAFGVQRNSHEDARCDPGRTGRAGGLEGWTSQASDLRSQVWDLRPQTTTGFWRLSHRGWRARICLGTNLDHATGHATVPESGVKLRGGKVQCNKEMLI